MKHRRRSKPNTPERYLWAKPGARYLWFRLHVPVRFRSIEAKRIVQVSLGTTDRKLLASPLFTGFECDGKEHVPGTTHARDWRYWIPLVCLFTGARISEVAQLKSGDVDQEGEIPFKRLHKMLAQIPFDEVEIQDPRIREQP